MGQTRDGTGIEEWRSVVDLFEENARATPDAPAVEAGEEALTYRALAERVERLAAALLPYVGPDRVVGVCLERDVDLPAWLLAILKVGAAYWPIDPTLPPARLAPMMEDARPAAIVASRRFAGHLDAAGAAMPIIAEDALAAANREVDKVEWPALRPEAMAYVIFTSGSTGRPKGVEIEHGSLAALMRTMAVRPGFARGERMLGLTRISFDLSVPDLFLPFTVGGALALVDLDVAADPTRLADAFDRHRPDLAQGTPSTWRALVEAGWRGLPALRVLAGGEALTRPLADRLLPRCGALWNIYGPTEATVWATCCRVEPGGGPVPIGWPMEGATASVVDGDLEPVPQGVDGEIVIGGAGVARGYRNRPALTAERFVTLPGGDRVYRTGDLGRFDRSGALFCLGRRDDQVKVRGFRIELGDVETALAAHPGVAWCAAKAVADMEGEALLAGYVVPREGADPTARDIRAFLAERLPAYMIPDRLLIVPAMPLTPNGKVDRAALPTIVASGADLAASCVTPTEERLAPIWRELLALPAVSAEDDFFECGGYSLMTVRLQRRIEATFGPRLPLIELMRHPTLSAMAARIDLGDLGEGPEAPLLTAPGDRPALFWLDAGPLMRAMLRALPAGQPVRALNTTPADEEALGDAPTIASVAERLLMRLRRSQPHGPYHLGGWCRWGIVAYELAARLRALGEEVVLLVLLDADPAPPRAPWRSRLRRLLLGARASPRDDGASFSQRVEAATRRYVPRPYDGDVLLLRPAHGVTGGWRRLVRGDLRMHRVVGDHVSMVRGASAAAMAGAIAGALASAARSAPEPAPSVRQAAMAT